MGVPGAGGGEGDGSGQAAAAGDGGFSSVASMYSCLVGLGGEVMGNISECP